LPLGQPANQNHSPPRNALAEAHPPKLRIKPPPTNSGLFNQHLAEPVYKGVTIGIVPKDFPALDSTHDDVVKRTRSINSGFSWHTNYKYHAKLIMLINISIPVP
jgi:hypothetical protein